MNRALLTDKEVAYEYDVSVHTLRHGRYRPNISVPQHIRQGGRVLYWRDEVVRWALSRGIVLSGPRQRPEK